MVLLIYACGPSIEAPRAPGDKNIVIQIYTDRDIVEGMEQARIDQRNQLCDWMEQDLANILNDAGYEASVISSRDQFVPGPGKHLLFLKLVNYNPGSKAARMWVGMGAGAASLDMRYELYGEGEEPLLQKDHGVGSGRDWKNCARKLNEQTAQVITDKLAGIYR